MDSEDIKQKAQESVTLSRGTMWLLRIAAATGVVSLISHGFDALDKVLGMF